MLIPHLKALRPHQWTKNLLLLAGIVFSNHFTEPPRIALALMGFAAFCLASSAIYLINDIHDAESDRKHPRKRMRPIASGLVKIPTAWTMAAVCLIVSLGLSFMLNHKFLYLIISYMAMMVAYSMALKHVVVLDLMIVAIGFVLRAIGGVYAIEFTGEIIPITPWFITCALFLSLFIIICKRRHELLLLSDDAKQHRPVLDDYSPLFLDQMVSVATTATVMSYALYVVLSPAGLSRPGLVYTVPFVLYGVFRYLYLVYKREEGGSPETLLFKDLSLLITVVVWLIVTVALMYR